MVPAMTKPPVMRGHLPIKNTICSPFPWCDSYYMFQCNLWMNRKKNKENGHSSPKQCFRFPHRCYFCLQTLELSFWPKKINIKNDKANYAGSTYKETKLLFSDIQETGLRPIKSHMCLPVSIKKKLQSCGVKKL